jgi:hypothetical protein
MPDYFQDRDSYASLIGTEDRVEYYVFDDEMEERFRNRSKVPGRPPQPKKPKEPGKPGRPRKEEGK